MFPWEKYIPEYLTDRKNIVNMILFTAAFALVFINLYAPFGVDKWLDVSSVQLFAYSSIVILIGMLVIAISRVLMYGFTRKKPMKYGTYAIWIFAEIVVLAMVYALIQTLFIQVRNDFLLVLRNAIKITACIILLPYFIAWLYLSFKDKYMTLEKLESRRSGSDLAGTLEARQGASLSMIPFRDEKGMLKFSIKKEDLLYIEAADNYILIYYLHNKKPSKYMIRTTLKRVEQELSGSGLVRSHRSFMVNIDNVKVIRKEKDGLIIGFDSPADITVPISKTYLDPFIKKLSRFTGIDDAVNQ
jgi:DNA-binding LytR/AlgR family response regulator